MKSPLRSILAAGRACTAGLADLLLPNLCPACGLADVSADGLCSKCNVQLLSLVAIKYCPRCGAAVGPNIPIRQDGCQACPAVLPRFARVVRLGPYAEPLRGIIRQLKYRRREALRHRLGRMLTHAVIEKCPEGRFDLIMPVPMHWRRRLARGYDHARVLAKALGRELFLPVGCELIRTRNTPEQVRLPRSRRVENVRGAFATTGRSAIRGANVLLVDDVTTTGATAGEAAKTLLAGGALSVTLAVIAKAEPPTAYARFL